MAKQKKNNSNYKIPFHEKKRQQIQTFIRRSVKRGDSPQQIYDNMHKKGISYRKQNVLADIRLKNATINAKTPAARKNAETWFLNVFEPFRKQNKLDSAQAKKQWENAVSQSFKTYDDAKLITALRDEYISIFKRSPRKSFKKKPGDNDE